MKRFLDRLRRNEKGATAIEYGLIVGIIAIGLIAVWRQIGFDLRPIYNYLSGEVDEEVEAARSGE